MIVRMALVTGSSSLDPDHCGVRGTSASAGWALALIAATLDGLGPHGVVLHTGTSTGPDAWAEAWANGRGLMAVRYALDGTIYADGCAPEPWTSAPVRRDVTWRVDRARVLAAILGQVVVEGDLAKVLILSRPQELARDHDVLQAEASRLGVEVLRRMCPRDLLRVNGR